MGLREQMPLTAAWVDELRQAIGQERVDAAIKAGQQLSREYARQEAAKGHAGAQAWLARQKCPHGLFWAAEGGVEFGVRRP